jgi:protein O-GlcNAc transferase
VNSAADWLERGRAHMAAGRPIDAMWCFRRAARLDARNADARFHLGEALWQLRRPDEARAAWLEAIAANAGHAPAHHAYAEASLAAGDASAALAAARAALVPFPGDARFAAVAAIAALSLAPPAADANAEAATGEGSAETAVAELLAREPPLLAEPALAGPLAVALDRAPATAARRALLTQLARAPQWLRAAPSLLLALVLEDANAGGAPAGMPALLAVARERAYAPAEHDALRRMARAARQLDPATGDALAQKYAALCATLFLPPVPLLWPRRTAGARVRLLVLQASAMPDAVAAVSQWVDALPDTAFDVTRIDVDAQFDPDGGEGDAVEVSLARAFAMGDPDVLLDLTGLAAATGPLLAQRPARAIWTTAALPWHHVAPLVDRVWPDAASLAAAPAEMQAAAASAARCELDAATLKAQFADAVRAHQGGDAGGARARYEALLQQQPGHAATLYLLGAVKNEGGDNAGARADLAAALAIAPGYIEARLAAARAAMAAGDARAAVQLCEDGLARDPGHGGLWRALGLAQLARRDGAAAVAAFERALPMDPTDAPTHFNHGVALQMQGQPHEAGRAYQRALVFNPQFPAAEFNLGILLQQMNQPGAAINAFENVLKAEPGNAAAYKNLAEVLYAAGQIDAWLALFRRFESNCPDALSLAVVALQACQLTGDFAGLERCLDRLRKEEFQPLDENDLVACLEELLYLLLFFDVEPEMMAKFAETYDRAARHVYGEAMPRAATRRPGRIRVGYLSADLRNHVMGKMVWPALSHHDKSRFELFFYSLSASEDAWTARFRELADHYEVVDAMSDGEAAARIAADDLDVLVDLNTHTKGARPGILAHKPARVAITHVASAGITGLSAIDFKLTDHFADVPENQAFQQEALLAMEGCVYPYRHIAPAGAHPSVPASAHPSASASAHPFHRAALAIAPDTVVIGAFITAMKLSRRCVTVWREILAKIPRAKLAFSPLDPALRGLYVRALAASGIPADRVLFLPQGRDDAENQARYALVDFVLDPMPYGGANGTLEALDMGVPVVTLVGKRHAERSSYSILANLGVRQTIAQTGREYVDIAVRLAGDRSFMDEVRGAIRARLPQSALTDMPAHARNLEAAYLRALELRAPEVLPAVRS